MKAIMGGLRRAGEVRFMGENIIDLASCQIAQRGLDYVPENRAMFADLPTVQHL